MPADKGGPDPCLSRQFSEAFRRRMANGNAAVTARNTATVRQAAPWLGHRGCRVLGTQSDSNRFDSTAGYGDLDFVAAMNVGALKSQAQHNKHQITSVTFPSVLADVRRPCNLYF